MSSLCAAAGGYTMPVGAQVGINILHLHRNPDVFPRPLDFDPDRFLDGGGPSHRFGYLPFSASLRNCIGTYSLLSPQRTISFQSAPWSAPSSYTPTF